MSYPATARLLPDESGYPGSYYPGADIYPGVPAVLANTTATAVLAGSPATAVITSGPATAVLASNGVGTAVLADSGPATAVLASNGVSGALVYEAYSVAELQLV